MVPLEKIIIDTIHRKGPITFETFMDMALYYPDLGYYTSPDLKIGRKGDFYTSSHLHPIFGAMIGRQLEEMWEFMGRPSGFQAVEIGAGAGYLCKDILDYLKDREVFNSITYVIVEFNQAMREYQKKIIEGYHGNVHWASTVQKLTNIRGCIFSNELLDAFPVHVVEMRDGLKEVYVALEGDALQELLQETNTPALNDYFKELHITVPEGYRTEVNLRMKGWIHDISNVLTEGFLMSIDYGYNAREYYDGERNRGTLLCYSGHRYHESPFINIGRQDITAHVNFTSLKKWGEEHGLQTAGYCPQGTFLVALGIDEVISEFLKNSSDYASETGRIKGLILPQGMGETHKVMVQYKGCNKPEFNGFSLRNLTTTL
jgi:SAM-dependent MidA family methyltransferase